MHREGFFVLVSGFESSAIASLTKALEVNERCHFVTMRCDSREVS